MQVGDVVRKVAPIELDDRARLDPGVPNPRVPNPSIMMHDQTAVARPADIELDPIDTHRDRQPEGLDGVLESGPRCAAVGDNVGHR